ncbi:MAG TPA: phosphatase PAP2 family protein [Candidatus Sulfotelmatobacter sp.]|jgi:membrane-associated phospholipid phosphatase
MLLPPFAAAMFSATSLSQTAIFGPEALLPDAPSPYTAMPSFDVSSLPTGTFDRDALEEGTFDRDTDQDPASSVTKQPSRQDEGLVKRSVKRTLEDQRDIYLAPLKPSNFRWDLPVLAGAAVFFVTDHRIENSLPGGHYTFYQDSSDVAIAALGSTLAGVWLYGIKTDHPHAKETGEIELETLVNTFLIYTPMQFIAARQRPGEGNGHGDFLRHSAINTSFPGGHAMFTWAMATVVAQEYPKPWIQVLNYTAALTVTTTRFLARDHWASDMWVGAALGVAIGTHVFHARCDPGLSASCERHHEKMLKRKEKLAKSPLAAWPNHKPMELYDDESSIGRPISQ